MSSFERAGSFRSFAHPNFRRYFFAQGLSATGTWLQVVAQTILVLRLTGSGTALGLLMTFQFGPTLLLGAWVGVLLDRHDKRRLLSLTTSVMAVTAFVLGLVVLTDNESLLIVYLLALVLGVANAFDGPGRRTLVNELVPHADINNAVNLYATLFTVARLIGPAIAGILVTTVGIAWCFLLNGLSFVAPLIALRRMDPELLRTADPIKRDTGQLRDGLRYARSRAGLRVPLLLVGVIGLFGFNFQLHLPLLATQGLHGSDASYTALSSAFGLGCLAGSLYLAGRRSVTNVLLGWSALTLGIASGALAMAPDLRVALIVAVVVGGAAIVVTAGANTVIAVTAVPQMRGRMIALYTVVALGSTPIGGPIAGSIAETLGARAGLAAAAVVTAFAGAVALVSAKRSTETDVEVSPPAAASVVPL